MDGSWDEKAIFVAAIELHEGDRSAFLDGACPDSAVRARVEALLAHHDQAADFLRTEQPDISEGIPHQIHEFSIIRKLGEGGMGIVYLAEDGVLGRWVALKVLGSHLVGSHEALSRFVDEARSAAVLKHPSIVQVFKCGFDGQHHYIASEYVDGPTLAKVIEDEKARRTSNERSSDIRHWHRRVAEIVAAIADALDASHQGSIIHRDVKPSNVLMDPERGPRLTDFGVAKRLTADAKHTAMIGSCHYMSPEQASFNSTIDHRSDVFSLGVVLYEMLTLRKPFDGSDIDKVLRAVITEEPKRPRHVISLIPRDVETICLKALEKNPLTRYQSAGHMAADLRCWVRGEPILAQPPHFARRCRRWIRRHTRAVMSLALSILTLATVGLMVVVWQARQSRLCAVQFSSDSAQASFIAQRVDPMTLSLGPRVKLGSGTVRRRMEPGQYRVTCDFLNGGFLQATVLLLQDRSESLHFPAPAAPVDDDMILVPGGEYECGWEGGRDYQAPRRIWLDAFFLDRCEVSNAEYRSFVVATGHPEPVHWRTFGYREDLADRPIVDITWNDAQAYARWAGKRLPTVFEWECAMRAPDSRVLPWGEDAIGAIPSITLEDRERMDSATELTGYLEYAKHAMSVQSAPALATRLGFFHAATNVQEFTDSIKPGVSTQVIIKGASWVNLPEFFDLTQGRTMPLETRNEDGTVSPVRSYKLGFRCARSADF